MKLAILAAAVPLLAGCTAVPPADLAMSADPTDPQIGLTDVHYHPVVNYRHREPTGPANWRRLNDRLSPAGQGEEL